MEAAEDLYDIYLPLIRHEQQIGFGLALRKETLLALEPLSAVPLAGLVRQLMLTTLSNWKICSQDCVPNWSALGKQCQMVFKLCYR